MLRKPDLYNKAILLRSKGFSQNEIRRRIPIAHGTVSRWCRDVILTQKQKERLIRKRNNNPFIRYLKQQAFQSRKEARIWAKEQVSKILFDENKSLLIAGAMLYWAEGSKLESRNGIEFTNTDPKIITLMMRFFREMLSVPEDKFKIIIRISDRGDEEKAKTYWSKVTNVSRRNFRRSEKLKLTPNSKSLRRYPYGMCRIYIYDILTARKVANLIKEFSKKFLDQKNLKNNRMYSQINFVPVAQRIRAEAS